MEMQICYIIQQKATKIADGIQIANQLTLRIQIANQLTLKYREIILDYWSRPNLIT